VDDPQRIVDDPDASPLARSLLASAADDAPSASHRTAVAKRLGIAAGLIAGSGEVGVGAAAGAGAIWWKVGLIVVALGGAITGGVALTRDPAPAPAPVVAAAPVTSPPPAPAPAAPAPEPPAPEPPAPSAIAPAPAPAPAPVERSAPAARPPTVAPPPRAKVAAPVAPPALPPVSASPPPPPPPAEPAPAVELPAPPAPLTPAPAINARRLAAEVAVLDRARAALRRGDTGAATTALDEHAREFADGALVAEAELVRIETLIRAGDAGAARRRARDFLARFPQSPLARRLRSLVDRLPPSAKESP
jgi:hypothetical protein